MKGCVLLCLFLYVQFVEALEQNGHYDVWILQIFKQVGQKFAMVAILTRKNNSLHYNLDRPRVGRFTRN